jgi:anti-sigma regulatory factor (Ser/Thr protein kinase)
LTEVRKRAQDAAISAGIDEERAWKFATGVGEAVTNAVKHAGGGRACLCRTPEGLLLLVEDDGPGIPSLSLPDVALRRGYSTAGTLGVGYKIMISFADRTYLGTGPKGTTVGIVMKLKPDKPSIADMAQAGALG